MMKCIWCVVYKISTLVKSGAQGVANHLQHEEKMLVSPDVVSKGGECEVLGHRFIAETTKFHYIRNFYVDRQFELDLQKGREKYKGATRLKKERKKWERKNKRNQSKSPVKEEGAEPEKEEKEKEEQGTEKEEEEEEATETK
ncbi:hypothetical protein ISN44_As05g049410 [Arabidopsis suecica]|uniref:Uncharacterized protein n=1 Tax=Arabidopsis suecica TaxID=45249 RepID=A0A8T2DR91_ARASU|nr:hypothetical protein ISN44_As05g049410 [Arabidopsis suecica]